MNEKIVKSKDILRAASSGGPQIGRRELHKLVDQGSPPPPPAQALHAYIDGLTDEEIGLLLDVLDEVIEQIIDLDSPTSCPLVVFVLSVLFWHTSE